MAVSEMSLPVTAASGLSDSRYLSPTNVMSDAPPKSLSSRPPQHAEHLITSYPGRHVLQLTLNRPDALNAMTVPLKTDILKVLDWFDTEPDLWVVVLTGAGRAFCAGQDLKK